MDRTESTDAGTVTKGKPHSGVILLLTPEERRTKESVLKTFEHTRDAAQQGVERIRKELGMSNEKVDHPVHYGGKDNPYEAIKVIEAWKAGFNLGNALKYVCRVCYRPSLIIDPKNVEDLKKARWYLDREIQRIEGAL